MANPTVANAQVDNVGNAMKCARGKTSTRRCRKTHYRNDKTDRSKSAKNATFRKNQTDIEHGQVDRRKIHVTYKWFTPRIRTNLLSQLHRAPIFLLNPAAPTQSSPDQADMTLAVSCSSPVPPFRYFLVCLFGNWR